MITIREPAMQPHELTEWRKRLRLKKRDACAMLGIGATTLDQYESGHHRGTGDPRPIPRSIALACSAIAFGLPPYGAAPTPRDVLGVSEDGRWTTCAPAVFAENDR